MKINGLSNAMGVRGYTGLLWVWLFLLSLAFTQTGCGDKDTEGEIYTVVFETDGGTPVPAAQRVEAGGTATAPSANVVKAGYVFVCWHEYGSTTAYSFQTPVNRDIILYARWQPEATAEYWRVTWDLNGGSWPADDNHAAEVLKGGTLAEPNVPVKPGCEFEGWYRDTALTGRVTFPYDVSGVMDHMVLYAKWKGEGGGTAGDRIVYTAGYYVNQANVEVACYWKNDRRFDLTNGSSGARAHDIAVVDDVVYTAGYYRAGSNLIACYWIDNVRYDLCAVPDNGEAMAIVVMDGKVYTSGYCNTSGNDKIACYWVNQERHTIYSANTSKLRWNIAYDIAVFNGVVYTCGNYYFGSDRIACFWVGSAKYDLQSTNYDSYAYSMFYTGSEFYIAGAYGDGRPCCFKTQVDGSYSLVPLNPEQTGGYARAVDVWVSGNDTYVVGYRGVMGNDEGLFWKNNIVEQAPDAKSVYLFDGVIYLAGSAGEKLNHAACYWSRSIHGTSFQETILTGNGRANAIVVK